MVWLFAIIWTWGASSVFFVTYQLIVLTFLLLKERTQGNGLTTALALFFGALVLNQLLLVGAVLVSASLTGSNPMVAAGTISSIALALATNKLNQEIRSD